MLNVLLTSFDSLSIIFFHFVLLEGVHIEIYVGLLTTLFILIQLIRSKTLVRAPPVPRKSLHRRPGLQILFKPDSDFKQPSSESVSKNVLSEDDYDGSTQSESFSEASTPDRRAGKSTNPNFTNAMNDVLPDSFAPLLSSSETEIVKHHLSPDLLHALQLDFSAVIRGGECHEVPFINDRCQGIKSQKIDRISRNINLDKERPQLQLNLTSRCKQGCKINMSAIIGSDGLLGEQDFDIWTPTSKRSQPIIKSAKITLYPALPLLNVAPTLIHFPNLFEDDMIPFLQQFQLVRFIWTMLSYCSSLFERSLWVIESIAKIHLSKVSITPVYKGLNKSVKTGEKNPQWMLRLSFSGNVIIAGLLPIPFFSVSLPTMIIPGPHALLNQLLTTQPLASGKLKRENINEDLIAEAVLDSLESWSVNLRMLLTPPSFGIDLTLPGGISVAVETMFGRDTNANSNLDVGNVTSRKRTDASNHPNTIPESYSGNSLSTWTSYPDQNNSGAYHRPSKRFSYLNSANSPQQMTPYDANEMVPWVFSVSASGKNERDNIEINLKHASATHINDPNDESSRSHISLSGNLVVCRDNKKSTIASHNVNSYNKTEPCDTNDKKQSDVTQSAPSSSGHREGFFKTLSTAGPTVTLFDPPSVCSLLLFPEKYSSKSSSVQLNKKLLQHSNQNTKGNYTQSNILHYDYALQMDESSCLDAISMSLGASHPMLKGGTMITTILESIFAHGIVCARHNATLQPFEWKRKRNILRHLPAVDFSCGIQNAFIPEESMSYSDDGRNTCIPELLGGRMTIKIVGGFDTCDGMENEVGDTSKENSVHSFSLDHRMSVEEAKQSLEVADGIKMIADFGAERVALHNESDVSEFPELDIGEGTKLSSLFVGSFSGRLSGHLRPQTSSQSNVVPTLSSHLSDPNHYLKSQGLFMMQNMLNPLEAFEIDFSGTAVSLKVKEASVTMGHRRVIFPTESTFSLDTVESVLDMQLEGKSHCEFCWDFQGSSPILQVTHPHMGSPANVSHEDKRQLSILIYALRQGRLNFHISSVGGVHFTKAATSREYKEGLYDWKFFNALVAPDHESASRLVDILHDKPTMQKLLNVIKLLNQELGVILDYVLTQVWRTKVILDKEEIQEASHVIPGEKMARLVSNFVCGDASLEYEILPIIKRVTAGEGLDTHKVKELLQEHLSVYEKWAPEIDRAVRWAAVLFGPMPATQPYVENHVLPLSELPHHSNRFLGIPSAKVMYETLNDKLHLPLDPHYSNMFSLIAPYMSFKQVEYFLQARSANDWQPADLRRVRYVYYIKKKVLDISESYGGLSFLPQSFLLSVFVGEATRASLKARGGMMITRAKPQRKKIRKSILSNLRRMHLSSSASVQTKTTQSSFPDQHIDDFSLSPAGKVASQRNSNIGEENKSSFFNDGGDFSIYTRSVPDPFELGDSLLGPQDVAILLQAGLASSNKDSTVVQLNQRMLLDLMASQPNSFAVGVLSELGNPGGHGSPRGLASALMALLELDQSSFKPSHRLDIHALLSSWTGIKIPYREWYLAGGRWARQSYYDALYTVAKSILEDAEVYLALKGHVQRVRHKREQDPLPLAKELRANVENSSVGMVFDEVASHDEMTNTKLTQAIEEAKMKIKLADKEGEKSISDLRANNLSVSECESCTAAISLYWEAFKACQFVLSLDKLAFQADWFKQFYRRNYDALMVKSVYDNVVEDIDKVREWLDALRNGIIRSKSDSKSSHQDTNTGCHDSSASADTKNVINLSENRNKNDVESRSDFFNNAANQSEQSLIDEIIECIFYDKKEKEIIRADPIVRLLISNPEGHYNFSIITAMGVITDGKRGHELEAAFKRLEKERGVLSIRADTGTARSFEFNASKIEEAIETIANKGVPFGLLGYSQGCANMLTAESLLLSGPPSRQKLLRGLVCRQLLFSAVNSSLHGASSDAKGQKLIVMCEEAFKYQQGYFSSAFISTILGALNGVMDSAGFHKFIGGAQSLLPEGCRAFWREAQHMASVPTSVIRGVMEKHTTPECLEMISNLLTKQSGSALHDSQVHVYDAIGHPVYTLNRNGNVLKNCDMGGSIQRTHHWSPLDKEVEFLRTKRDIEYASFECAKDRHVFPWVDVNARFGFITYKPPESDS